jgi:hypothetical protein
MFDCRIYQPSVWQPELFLPGLLSVCEPWQVAQQMQQMQQALKRPEIQKQVEEMTAAMQNQQLQERMAKLKVLSAHFSSPSIHSLKDTLDRGCDKCCGLQDDPELQHIFEDIQ